MSVYFGLESFSPTFVAINHPMKYSGNAQEKSIKIRFSAHALSCQSDADFCRHLAVNQRPEKLQKKWKNSNNCEQPSIIYDFELFSSLHSDICYLLHVRGSCCSCCGRCCIACCRLISLAFIFGKANATHLPACLSASDFPSDFPLSEFGVKVGESSSSPALQLSIVSCQLLSLSSSSSPLLLLSAFGSRSQWAKNGDEIDIILTFQLVGMRSRALVEFTCILMGV